LVENHFRLGHLIFTWIYEKSCVGVFILRGTNEYEQNQRDNDGLPGGGGFGGL
jgi:hypothetical protein